MLTAMLFARLSSRRLAVDWSDSMFSPNGQNAFPQLFSKPTSEFDFTEIRDLPVAPAFWRDRIDWSVRRLLSQSEFGANRLKWAKLSADPLTLHYNEDVIVYWSLYERIHRLRPHFRGEFQHLARQTDEAILRSLTRSELVPHPEVAERIRQFRARHWRDEVVGVHLRCSDLKCRVPAILRRVDKLMRNKPERAVFVATDNIEMLEQVRSRYGADRTLATDKWFPNPGEAIHFSSQGPDAVEKAREALVDLYLLASAGWIVSDERSSYAYMARLLFEGPMERISNLDPGGFMPRRLGHLLGEYRMALAVNLRRMLRFQRA